MTDKPKFKILCIDGGGIRGILPCIILQEIERRMNKPISSLFDLIAGTSTGGIIALGLTVPNPDNTPKFSPTQLQELYSKTGKLIFKKKFFNIFTQFFSPKYAPDNLEMLLKQYLGDAKLNDALTNVLVPALDTISNKPFYFLTRLAKDTTRHPSENFLMRDIARATSAGPTFFPAKDLDWRDKTLSLVDGGTFANNPSTLAFTEGIELVESTELSKVSKSPTNRVVDPVVIPDADAKPFFLLSLGTGLSEDPISLSDAQRFGSLNWIIRGKIINLVMHGTSEGTHYEMQYILPDYPDGTKRYVRINPTLWKNHGFNDDATDDNINKLIDLGNQTLMDNVALIDQICESLRE